MTETTEKGNELARGERLQVMIDQEELQALEDFRFNNRMPSRAAAVRELLRRGLAATGYRFDEKRGASSDYGVTRGYVEEASSVLRTMPVRTPRIRVSTPRNSYRKSGRQESEHRAGPVGRDLPHSLH